MKNIVVAAGYATRLGELTKNFPKPLLQIGKSTILGRMMDDIDAIPEIDEHIIVTNHKFAKIFEMLKDVPEEKRTAKFGCSIAVVRPDGSEFTVRGEICGVLHEKPMGDGGFGYDPIFYVPEFGMTTAQMTKEQKNSISHRGKASRAMAEKLKEELG